MYDMKSGKLLRYNVAFDTPVPGAPFVNKTRDFGTNHTLLLKSYHPIGAV